MHQHPGATFMLPVNSTGQHYRSTLLGMGEHEHDAILGRSNIYSALRLLSSQALTSLSFRPLKGLKTRFLSYFTYFKEFKNAKIIQSLAKQLEHMFLEVENMRITSLNMPVVRNAVVLSCFP